MGTCLVTIAAKTPTGEPFAGAVVTFTPYPSETLKAQDAGVIWPTEVRVVCDGSGVGSTNLKTGLYQYVTTGPLGYVRAKFTVPDLVTASLDVLIGAAEPPYVTITWAEYQTLVSATAAPAVSVTAGLAAVADGVTFLAVSDDGVSIIRRVSGAAVPAFVEI